MADQNTYYKVALILLIVAVLLCGGLGIMYMTKLGSKIKPDTIEAQLSEEFRNIRALAGDDDPMVKGLAKRLNVRLSGDVKGEIPELREKIESRKNIVRQAAPDSSDLVWEFTGKKAEIEHLKQAMKLEDEEEVWGGEIVVVKGETDRLRRSRNHLKMLKERWKAHHEFARTTRSSVSSQLEGGPDGANLQELRRDKDKLEQGYTKRRNNLQTDSDEITKELTKERLRYESRFKNKRDKRSRLETEYVQIREELQKYMVREPPAIDVSYDGMLLTVDIATRVVVLDIGTRHGVKLGMRFGVFQIRGGGRRIHKGYLYVRNVSRETANCIIMDKAVMFPRCPSDGYTARYPEERFCPYCSGSGGDLRVQKLSAIPKEANMGMNPDEPMVVGDYVQNPFFERGKRLHFAVKGDTENPVAETVPTEEFITAVRRHGGILDAEVTAQTDVLIAGKYAVEDVRRARELGVRIIRQYELFDFLRK